MKIDPYMLVALFGAAVLVVVAIVRFVVMIVRRNRGTDQGVDCPPQPATGKTRTDAPKERLSNGEIDTCPNGYWPKAQELHR